MHDKQRQFTEILTELTDAEIAIVRLSQGLSLKTVLLNPAAVTEVVPIVSDALDNSKKLILNLHDRLINLEAIANGK